MAKCPKCNNEIDYLLLEEEGITLLIASLFDGSLEYQESAWNPYNDGVFICPNCNAKITDSEEEAIKILSQE